MSKLYHETVPSEAGYYYEETAARLLWLHCDGKWFDGDRCVGENEMSKALPLLGPLPSTNDEAIALACEVAFARMVVADYQWCSGNGTGPTTDEATRDVMPRLSDCEHRFVRKGERSLSLYRDMERVTRELGGC